MNLLVWKEINKFENTCKITIKTVSILSFVGNLKFNILFNIQTIRNNQKINSSQLKNDHKNFILNLPIR